MMHPLFWRSLTRGTPSYYMEYTSVTTFLLLGYTSSARKGLEEIQVGLALLEGFLLHV